MEYTYREYVDHPFNVDFEQIYYKQINKGILDNIEVLSEDFSLNGDTYLHELYNVPNDYDSTEAIFDDMCEDYYLWLKELSK